MRHAGAVSEDVDTGWLDSLIGYQMRRATASMGADYAWFAGPDRLRPTQTITLGIIADNPGVHASTVGTLLRVARANMVQIVNALVEHGLVERRNSPADKRVVELHLTPAGEEEAQRAKAFMADHEARMTSHLTDRQRAQLHDLLRRVADHDTVKDAPRGRQNRSGILDR